eukprot:2412641-Pleurochrysis_carterae.AAC.4
MGELEERGSGRLRNGRNVFILLGSASTRVRICSAWLQARQTSDTKKDDEVKGVASNIDWLQLVLRRILDRSDSPDMGGRTGNP